MSAKVARKKYRQELTIRFILYISQILSTNSEFVSSSFQILRDDNDLE